MRGLNGPAILFLRHTLADIISNFLNGAGTGLASGINTSLSTLNTQNSLGTNSVYGKTDNSYSGCDMRATVTDSRTGSSKIIGNLATLSYSSHREVYPVRNLGSTMAKAYTRGQRTIAGTLVFSLFDRYALYDVAAVKSKYDRGVGESAFSLLGDQMAPFNVTCSFINETGNYSVLNIYGIQLIDEGQVMSINDIFIESTHSYVATNIDVMYPQAGGPLTVLPNLLNTGAIFNSGPGAVQQGVVPGPSVPLPSAPTSL